MDRIYQLIAELPVIEQKIRTMLWWDVGDSRLLLWGSAFLTFFVVVNAVAWPVGWLVGAVTGLLFKGDRKPLR